MAFSTSRPENAVIGALPFLDDLQSKRNAGTSLHRSRLAKGRSSKPPLVRCGMYVVPHTLRSLRLCARHFALSDAPEMLD